MLVADLINYAFRISGVLGVGQAALPQDFEDARTTLDNLSEQWQRMRWLVFRLDDFHTTARLFKPTYTIGLTPDADIHFPRPSTIESVYLRQVVGGSPNSFPVDFPLRQIMSKEEWNAIPLKHLWSWPSQWFYDPTLPDGTFYIWPIPLQHHFELHFSVPQHISNIPLDRDLLVYLPPESQKALAYNLAVELRAHYDLPPNQGLGINAATSLGVLRTMNYRMRPLRMPPELRRNVRLKNPMAGFYPEVAAGIPFPVLS